MEIEMMEMSSPNVVFLVVPLRHKAHNTQKIKQRTRMHLKLICLLNMFFRGWILIYIYTYIYISICVCISNFLLAYNILARHGN